MMEHLCHVSITIPTAVVKQTVKVHGPLVFNCIRLPLSQNKSLETFFYLYNDYNTHGED